MKSRFRLVSSRLKTSELVKDLEDHDYLWGRHVERQSTYGSPHIDTETIFLRWSKELSVHTVFTDLVAVDYPELDLLPSARELISEVMHWTKSSELARVIIVRLKPGGSIPEHCDEGLYAETFERFHLCLSSSSGNYFYNESESVQMSPGQIWHFNHQMPHKVLNTSQHPRIHMIVDTKSEKYRALRLETETHNQTIGSEIHA